MVRGFGECGSGYLAVHGHVVTILLPLLLCQIVHDWSDWPLYVTFLGYRKAKEYPFHFKFNPTISWPAFFWQKKVSVALLPTSWKVTEVKLYSVKCLTFPTPSVLQTCCPIFSPGVEKHLILKTTRQLFQLVLVKPPKCTYS